MGEMAEAINNLRRRHRALSYDSSSNSSNAASSSSDSASSFSFVSSSSCLVGRTAGKGGEGGGAAAEARVKNKISNEGTKTAGKMVRDDDKLDFDSSAISSVFVDSSSSCSSSSYLPHSDYEKGEEKKRNTEQIRPGDGHNNNANISGQSYFLEASSSSSSSSAKQSVSARRGEFRSSEDFPTNSGSPPPCYSNHNNIGDESLRISADDSNGEGDNDDLNAAEVGEKITNSGTKQKASTSSPFSLSSLESEEKKEGYNKSQPGERREGDQLLGVQQQKQPLPQQETESNGSKREEKIDLSSMSSAEAKHGDDDNQVESRENHSSNVDDEKNGDKKEKQSSFESSFCQSAQKEGGGGGWRRRNT